MHVTRPGAYAGSGRMETGSRIGHMREPDEGARGRAGESDERCGDGIGGKTGLSRAVGGRAGWTHVLPTAGLMLDRSEELVLVGLGGRHVEQVTLRWIGARGERRSGTSVVVVVRWGCVGKSGLVVRLPHGNVS